MIVGSEVSGYVLAASVALSGATGARLKNSGELSKMSKASPFYTLIASVLYGLSGMAAMLYFSWAYLNWKHIVVFVLIGVFLTSWIGKTDSKAAVWSVFNLSVLASMVSEIYLLMSSSPT